MGVNVDIGSGGLAELAVPDGYEVSVFAEGLAAPRFMDVSADGVLFVAERGADRIVALPDRDGDGRADETIEVGRGYESAHSVAFEPDGGLLVAGETTLFRLRLGADLKEADRSVVLDGLTTGGHSTRTVAVLPDGQLLLSAGSTCNVCVESDPRRAAINLVPPEGGSSRVYMTGLRNAVGVWVDPATGRAWATDMGRDWLGDDLPPETVYEVVDGADAGWPRCHAGDLVDPEFGGEGACDGVADPAVTFGAHTAPLALAGMGGPPGRRPPRLVEPLGQGGVRALVAAVGWGAGRRSRAVRHRLPARRRAGRARPPGRPRRRGGRSALRVG